MKKIFKKHVRNSIKDVLFKRLVQTVTRSSLLVCLYLLWHEYSWTKEGLEEFMQGFEDYINTCDSENDNDVNELVESFKEDTGINSGLFDGHVGKIGGDVIRKNTLLIAQLFLWNVGEWQSEDLRVFEAMYWRITKAYDNGEETIIKGFATMQEETGLQLKLT